MPIRSIEQTQQILQKQLQSAFKKYDSDNSGQLQRNEFYPLFIKIAEQFGVQQPTSQQIDQIWDVIDINGDGKLTKNQFKTLIKDIVKIAFEDVQIVRRLSQNQNLYNNENYNK